MKLKQWAMVIVTILALAIMGVPMAHAACGDPGAPGVNWHNCDKTGADLSGLDLSGANLSGAILVNTILNGTIFTGANLNGANLTGAIGTPTTDSGSNFNGVTCPDGTPASGTSPFCSWAPLAVTLIGTGTMALTNLLPWAFAGLLVMSLMLLMLVRRRRLTAVI